MGKTLKSTHIGQNIGQEMSGRLIGKPWKPFGKVGQETGFGLSITWKHLEDPGSRLKKAARQKKYGKPKLHKTSKNKSRQEHARAQKNKQVSQMHALGFMTKTIQTGFSRALGKTPRKQSGKTLSGRRIK